MLSAPFLISQCTHAEVGQSAFAIRHERFPCDAFLKPYEGKPKKILAILDGDLFGKSDRCILKFLRLPGKLVLVVHPRYVPKSVPERLDYRLFSSMARKWEARRIKYPAATIYLTDGLESHSGAAAARKRVAYIRRFFKGGIVHNPLKARDPFSVGADVIELHGDKYIKYPGRETFFSYDGFGVDYLGKGGGRIPFSVPLSRVRSDAQRAARDGSILFLWDAWGQGTHTALGTRIKPRERNFVIVGNSIKETLL